MTVTISSGCRAQYTSVWCFSFFFGVGRQPMGSSTWTVIHKFVIDLCNCQLPFGYLHVCNTTLHKIFNNKTYSAIFHVVACYLGGSKSSPMLTENHMYPAQYNFILMNIVLITKINIYKNHIFQVFSISLWGQLVKIWLVKIKNMSWFSESKLS